jgi:hypothetical protein
MSVLLNVALTWAMPSASTTFLLRFGRASAVPRSSSLSAAATSSEPSSCLRSPGACPCGSARSCWCAGPGPGAPTMSQPAVAADVHETLDVHGLLGAERALDLELALDLPPKTVDVLVAQILGAEVGTDPARLDDLLRARLPDPVDVGQSDLDPLAAREVDACDTCHGLLLVPVGEDAGRRSTLTLLVLRISGADDADHALTADHLAVLADRLDAASDLHLKSPRPFVAELGSITLVRQPFKHRRWRASPLRRSCPAVRIRGPSAVIPTVCSKCADNAPSAVTTVHPSASVRMSGDPAESIGSMARTMPSRRSGPCPGRPTFGTCGCSCTSRPIP